MVIRWWLTILAIGIAFFPYSALLFARFEDRGWIFSKTLGLFLSGYVLWAFSCGHIIPFTAVAGWLIVIVFAAVGYGLLWKKGVSGIRLNWKLIAGEEAIFFLLYLYMIYLIGFNSAAYGTEKFMDFGFLAAMGRTKWLPFEDIWYAGERVNYYYGGQYYAAFLMKLSGSTPGYAYTEMRAGITAFSFLLPFVLVKQMSADRKGSRRWAAWLGGIIAGCAVAFAGNYHYVLYGIVGKLFSVNYWYPDSTRYIGYNPDTHDKTIHEFPAYSSVLGDLHAHYVNLIFAITVVAIAYAWAQRVWSLDEKEKKTGSARWMLRYILAPEVLLLGFFTGVFRWTNFWDFPIYYVVTGAILFFVNWKVFRKKWKDWVAVMILQAAVMFAVGAAAALPFTSNFDMISSSVKATYTHTPFYQLLILWGLPVGIFTVFCVNRIAALAGHRRRGEKTGEEINLPDLVIFLMGLCAWGLVFLPEVIYVVDIYGGDYYRSNTMFKLTYQAFILFGMMMGYVITFFITETRGEWRRIGVWMLILFLPTLGYWGNAVHAAFGDVAHPSLRGSTDATAYLETSFPEDAGAIRWLNSDVKGVHNIVEAPGDSYSDNERVSAMTGLPTIAGWYVHEWLWRGGTEGIVARDADCDSIYMASDPSAAEELFRKYDVEYIFIGRMERERYGDSLNRALLESLGTIVYSDDGAEVIEVGR